MEMRTIEELKVYPSQINNASLKKNEDLSETKMLGNNKMLRAQSENNMLIAGTGLFEMSTEDEQPELEELVFPSTSKVSDELSKVLASIRRAKERTAYEATQHINKKKISKVVKSGKKSDVNSSKNKTNSTALVKKRKNSCRNDDLDEFNTDLLDCSILFVENIPEGQTKQSENKEKLLTKGKKSSFKNEQLLNSEPEDSQSDSEYEHVICKSKTSTPLEGGTKQFVSGKLVTKTGVYRTDVAKDKKIKIRKQCENPSFNLYGLEAKKKQINITQEKDECNLDLNFEKIFAEGASKRSIDEKCNIFLKRKFEFIPTNKYKKHKHDIDANATTIHSSHSIDSDEGDLTVGATNVNESRPTSECSSKTLEIKKRNIKLNENTRKQLLQFSAKNELRESKIIDSSPVDDHKLNSSLVTDNGTDNIFDISSYCNLEISRHCQGEEEELKDDKGERNSAMTKVNSQQENSQQSVSLSNYSQTFSLIDGEEDLENINFDL